MVSKFELLKNIKERIPPKLWYTFFYKKPVKPKFDMVQLPKVNKKFS